jgi:hypothetical protein
MHWLSFAAGFAAAWLLAAAWAAADVGQFMLRYRGKQNLADLLGGAVVVSLILAAGYVAVMSVSEALVWMALNVRRY